MPNPVQIAIVNKSTVINDAMLTNTITAMQRQISEHFAPYWKIDAALFRVGAKETPPANAWQMLILDDPDQAGALGYHDVTAEGLPLGKAFVKADFQAGRPWTTTISHELLEILADPDISLSVEYSGSKKHLFFAREVCDPCQDDKWAYKMTVGPGTSGIVLVSDFILPGWYHSYRNYPYYDFAKHITKPLQILEGGYQSVLDIASGKGWQEVDARGVPPTAANARARIGSRRERRHVCKSQWTLSQPKETS